MRTKTTRRRAAALLAPLLAVAIVGCGPAPWTVDDPDPDPTTTVVPRPVPNDLSSGATQRELQAGAVAAEVDYWSSLAMDRWEPSAIKPLSMSLITEITPSDGQKVYLQKASMLVIPANDTETFPPLEAQTDAAAVTPGYLVLSPYSYSQTFNIGPVPDEATYATVQFTYDFLVQTTPTSNEYAKQTATDTITVAIAAPPASD